MTKNRKWPFTQSNSLTNNSGGTFTSSSSSIGLPSAQYSWSAVEYPTQDTINNCLQVFENTLQSAFAPAMFVSSGIAVKNAHPKTNIFIRPKQEQLHCESSGTHDLVIDMAMPYITKDEIDIETNDQTNSIIVSVKNHQEEGEVVTHLMREIPRSSFKQEICLPKEDYSVQDVKADLHDGVLRLVLRRRSPLHAAEPQTRKVKLG